MTDYSCSSSSSSASPKRSVLYYVESPSSRSESNNEGNSPLIYSPTPPPIHSPRTDSSSSSRLPTPLLGRSRKPRSAYYCYAITEETPEDVDRDDTNRPHYYDHNKRRPLLLFMAILGLFGFFCLILWGAAQPFKPAITLKSFTTHNLDLGVGTDYTGVPTRLLTLNCSADMVVHNPATFFGIHLRSNSLHLIYSHITIATGQIGKYYQPRKSWGVLKVKVEGNQVPLYGAGESLAKWDRRGRIPVRLVFHILSRGNVIGKLLRVKHQRHISCTLFIANSDRNEHSCIYT